ncbi:MAG TPA: chemotaxis protein CheX [Anaeromyxobacteraceae bacterium]|nr:chemotaxis protein CheX [Anaeromyxobacteraceae bacterium]
MAALVSGVTETMLGLSFAPETNASPSEALVWRTAVLPIAGGQPITVGLSSDRRGCAQLSAAMFGCADENVDQAMMDDSLRELVNMTAGLLKSAMSLDQQLGLPTVFEGKKVPPHPNGKPGHSLVLRGKEIGLVLWIFEGLL